MSENEETPKAVQHFQGDIRRQISLQRFPWRVSEGFLVVVSI